MGQKSKIDQMQDSVDKSLLKKDSMNTSSGNDAYKDGYSHTPFEADETPANRAARMQSKADASKKKYMKDNNVDENGNPIRSQSPSSSMTPEERKQYRDSTGG